MTGSSRATPPSCAVGERPLRVLTFTSLFPNVNQPLHGTFVRERIRALARLCDVRVVAPTPWVPDWRWVPAAYRQYVGIPAMETDGDLIIEHPRYVGIPKVLKGTDGVFMAASTLPQLGAVRRQFAFDVIDAHWAYPDGVAAAALAQAIRVPLAVTVRGDDINVFAEERGRRPWIRWALRRADLVVAVSSDLKRRVNDLVAGHPNVVVVPNGVDAGRFRPGSRQEARRRLGLPDGGRILLSAGRLHQSKGYAVIVEALGLLKSRFPDLSVVIVGDRDGEADATPQIIEAASRHGIVDRVRLVGPQPGADLPHWYNAADLFCLATTREGSPNVILEALACGVPCIACPVGGIPDLISHSTGRLIDPTPASAAAAIAESIDTAWDRTAIAAAAAGRTWARVAEEHHRVLRAIAERTSVPAGTRPIVTGAREQRSA